MPASALWAALQAAPRPHRIVPFPRNGPDGEPVGNVAIWVLTQGEHMDAAADAERLAREKLKDATRREDLSYGYDTLFSNELACQVIARACRQEDDLTRAAFPSGKMVRATLTPDEVEVLFRHYLSVQSELGPIVSEMTKEEMDAWVHRLAEGGPGFPFNSLSLVQQRILVRSMASQLVAFWTDKSSAGSQPESTEADEPASDDADVSDEA